eukprot:10720735-Alexandrium_andersonii.AAC.1
MPPSRVQAVKSSLFKAGYSAILSPVDPEAATVSGGVGILVRRPRAFQECTPRTVQFEQARAQGRACMALVGVGSRTPLLVVSFYAWATAQ